MGGSILITAHIRPELKSQAIYGKTGSSLCVHGSHIGVSVLVELGLACSLAEKTIRAIAGVNSMSYAILDALVASF